MSKLQEMVLMIYPRCIDCDIDLEEIYHITVDRPSRNDVRLLTGRCRTVIVCPQCKRRYNKQAFAKGVF